MKAKHILVLSLVMSAMFTEGCNLQDVLSRISINNQPLAPLGPSSTPGLNPDPLSGSLAGGLPLGPTAPGSVPTAPGAVPTAPGSTGTVPGAVPAPGASDPTLAAAPQNVPTSPASTPAGIVPPTPVTPGGNTGSAPQATPIGSGPILPGYSNAQLVGMSGALNPLSSTPSAGAIGL